MQNSSLFRGERVVLRAFEPGDAAALHAVLSHPDLEGRRSLQGGASNTLPLAQSKVAELIGKWNEAEKEATLAITLQDGGSIIGYLSMDWGWDTHCPSLVVVIAPGHQGKRYGSEAAGIALRFLFENTVAHTVSGWIDDWNEAGLAFARSLGFSQAGAMRRTGIRQGAYVNTVAVDMLRSEWLKRVKGG